MPHKGMAETRRWYMDLRLPNLKIPILFLGDLGAVGYNAHRFIGA